MMGNSQTRAKRAQQRYDEACRFAAHTDPVGIFAWVAAVAARAFLFVRWLNARTVPYPGEPDRICDTVAEVGDPNRRSWLAICVLEFQSRVDREIVHRLLEYLARVARALRKERRGGPPYGLLAGVINLTGMQRIAPLHATFPGSDCMSFHFQVGVRNVAEEDAATVLEEIATEKWSRILLGFVPLMKGGNDPATIERWKQVGSREPKPELRAVYRDLAVVFSELARCKALWVEGLEGWSTMRSALVEGWVNEGREAGLVQGRVEGRAEGREEGRVDEAQDLVLALGQRRLGQPTGTVTRRVKGIVDLELLRSLALRVGEVETWDELLAGA